VEVVVKPFLYDIYFRIESISEEGWNDETINLGKRAFVEIHGINDPVFDKSGKNLEMMRKLLVTIQHLILNWVSLPLKVKNQLSLLRVAWIFLKTNIGRA
jgi:hypothetical protein